MMMEQEKIVILKVDMGPHNMLNTSATQLPPPSLQSTGAAGCEITDNAEHSQTYNMQKID